MADVSVGVGGRRYVLACEAGEERRLEALAARIDAEAQALSAKLTQPPNEARLLLMAALMIADRLDEAETALAAERDARAEAAPPQAGPAAQAAPDGHDLFQGELDAAQAARVDAIAERIEALTEILRQP